MIASIKNRIYIEKQYAVKNNWKDMGKDINIPCNFIKSCSLSVYIKKIKKIIKL